MYFLHVLCFLPKCIIHVHDKNKMYTESQTKSDQYTIIALIWGEHRKLSPRGKATSERLTTWYSSHVKANTVLLYWNYSEMFNTWLFCFVVENKLIQRKYNYGTRIENKHAFSIHFRVWGVVDRVKTYCLLLHYMYVWVVQRVVSLVSKFSIKHRNCFITFI